MQPQTPLAQVPAPGHCISQAPQLKGSVEVSVQAQAPLPGRQATSPPSQSWAHGFWPPEVVPLLVPLVPLLVPLVPFVELCELVPVPFEAEEVWPVDALVALVPWVPAVELALALELTEVVLELLADVAEVAPPEPVVAALVEPELPQPMTVKNVQPKAAIRVIKQDVNRAWSPGNKRDLTPWRSGGVR